MRKLQIRTCVGHHFVVDRLGPDATVVDLGMNQGAFAAYISVNTEARVFGVEPVPELFSALPRDDRIKPFNVAVGGADGSIKLSIYKDHCASTLQGLVTKVEAVEEIEVPMISYKTLLELASVGRIHLLKIDIEGAELDMMDSMTDEELKNIEQITVEFHDFMDSTHLPRINKILQRLRTLGFYIVNYSIRNHADVLCVNEDALNLSSLSKLQLQLSNLQQAIVRLARGRWLGEARRKVSALIGGFQAIIGATVGFALVAPVSLMLKLVFCNLSSR